MDMVKLALWQKCSVAEPGEALYTLHKSHRNNGNQATCRQLSMNVIIIVSLTLTASILRTKGGLHIFKMFEILQDVSDSVRTLPDQEVQGQCD